MISKIIDNEILVAVETPIIIQNFPLHSQTVENNVKIVTKASSSVYGEEKQRTNIISILASQKDRKPWDLKKHFTVA